MLDIVFIFYLHFSFNILEYKKKIFFSLISIHLNFHFMNYLKIFTYSGSRMFKARITHDPVLVSLPWSPAGIMILITSLSTLSRPHLISFTSLSRYSDKLLHSRGGFCLECAPTTPTDVGTRSRLC